MHHLSQNKTEMTNRSAGFTLIEMLVIAPILVLAIGGFIAIMVTLVGQVFVTRDQSLMTFESQDALSRIEDDITLSTKFLTTTGTVQSPQGLNDTSTSFTNTSDTLILSGLVTDRSPLDTAREVIYYKNQPYPCDAQKIYNKVLQQTIVYFIQNNSLWRRTILPDNNMNATADANTTCAAPWQQNSCSPGYSASRCQTNDVEVMKNVASLSVEYYATPSDTTNLGSIMAESATAIKATITGSNTSAGAPITATQTLRAAKLNNDINISGGTVVTSVTNLHPNPSLESNNTGSLWQGWRGTNGAGNFTRLTNGGYSGSAYHRLTWTTAGSGGGIAWSFPATEGKTYTTSTWVRTSKAANIYCDWQGGGATRKTFSVPANTWTRIACTGTVPAGTTSVQANSYGYGAAVNDYMDGDAGMATEGTILYSYADGSSTNWAWVGTVNNSTSTGPPL